MSTKIEKNLSTIPGMLISFGSIVAFVIVVGWKAYGDPVVDEKIKAANAPIKQEVKELSQIITEVNEKANKTLLIIERMAPREIVKQVEREMELIELKSKADNKKD